MFLTKIPLESKDEVVEIMEDISDKDDSFGFKIEEKTYGHLLIVYSVDKDQAHQRGKWLLEDCEPIRRQNTYYWVREKKNEN